MLPQKIKKFIESFSEIPSIGPRMAHRLAFYLLNLDKEKIIKIKKSLEELTEINKCPRCFFIKDKDKKFCHICEDKNRKKNKIVIIEKEIELISLEKANVFDGIYLVIGESSSKGSLTSVQKKRLNHLKKIVKKANKKLEEIIIMVNPNTKGDLISEKIKNEIKGITKKITKLGRGIPTGAEIEFADEDTLNNAFKSRN
jgi:recombination protein RecR